ncbi:chemotaxis protein CheB [uncultured Sphingomonas sp.]|uniref:chemotaxis protein CheB n=1 Tax=uncultured Sphingomonas sp. TaxID=158754 RepID=UPI0035CBDFAE
MARSPSPHAAPAARTRILIVDDSVVARAVLTRAIEGSPSYAVVGSVPDVRAALAFLAIDQVDLVLLDVEMPGVDGLTALPDLIAAGKGARIVVVSSTCADGGAAMIQALALGAADTLEKPEVGAFAGRFGALLIEKLDRLFEVSDIVLPRGATTMPAREHDFDIVAIGASTGGIHALSQLLRALPAHFSQPILITQHLPASFMSYFAAQVAVLANRPCEVAEDRSRIRPGRILIAPGHAHMKVIAIGEGGAVRLTTEAVASGCMPSVDPMLRSVADVYGPRSLAVVLSGMGRDGAVGAVAIAAAGGSVVVQDRESSVVWGMPGAVAASGAAHAVLPPDKIGQLIGRQRRPAC